MWCEVLPRPQNRTTFSSRKSTRNHTDSQNPQNGDRGWPRPPKMTKKHGLEPPKSGKTAPQAYRKSKESSTEKPQKLNLSKGMVAGYARSALDIYIYIYILV